MSKLNKCKNYIECINIFFFVYCALEDFVILLLSGIQKHRNICILHISKKITCTTVMEALPTADEEI